MSIISIHQPNFLPWPGYFSKIIKSDIFVFLDDVKCSKNSFFNRNRFSSNDSWFWLGIPVSKTSYNLKINEVTVDNKFIDKHLKYFKLSHKKKTQEKEIIDALICFYERKYQEKVINLSQFNIELIILILSFLDCNTKIVKSSDLEINSGYKKQDLLIEIIKSLEGKEYISGFGAKAYQEESRFLENDISICYNKFSPNDSHMIDNECMSIVDCFLRSDLQQIISEF